LIEQSARENAASTIGFGFILLNSAPPFEPATTPKSHIDLNFEANYKVGRT